MSSIQGMDHILRLPSSPIYMSMIKTLKGKPMGNPIWLSFDHKEGLSLENENVSSTLISLTRNIANLGTDKKKKEKGKVIRLSHDGRSYAIFIPDEEDVFQVSFVVVFEERDTIIIEDKYREELVRLIIEKLSKLDELVKYVKEEERLIKKEEKLHAAIKKLISQVIMKWDDKRVKYIKKREEEERKRLLQLAKEAEKQQAKAEKAAAKEE